MSVVLILSSYLLGSIPSAYIAGRLSKGIDIRNFGDGNVGAGNAYRVIKPAAGVAVFMADASKGAIAVLVAQAFGSQPVALLAGFAVVAGHNWPVYIGFRGGIGQSTTIGILCALLPQAMGILLAASVIPFFVMRNRMLAGLIQFAPLWFAALLLGAPGLLVAYSIVLPCLMGFRYLQTAKRRRMMLARTLALTDEDVHQGA
ncbi:MAG: glycerol-3-phosphate acyltransferase [Dehalococcoidia bacterium]